MNGYLITGGDGFIGGRIAAEIGGVSYDIKSGNNILDGQKLKDECGGKTGVFHCAAKISVPESVQMPNEYYQTNVIGTKNVVSAAETHGLKIVFSSSAAVYGKTTTEVEETAWLDPQSPYAQNKKEGEELLEQARVRGVALRYFNVYGPGQSAEYAGVVTTFIRKALQGNNLIIYGDGTQVRDFIFVDDVVRANQLAMKMTLPEFEIFNIGSGTETSIQELAELVIKLTNSKSRISYEPSRQGDLHYSKANITKARRFLGWHPTVSLEKGLLQTIEYLKE